MKPPSELIAASAAAYLRVLNANDYQTRQAAEREYQHLESEIRRIETAGVVRKVTGPTHTMPLNADPRGLVR